jgi:uncharacterized protein (TIGR02147 family)
MENEKNILFRLTLKDELLKRTKKNPSYSIRSFAKNLGVEHSSLAQIIMGKRPLTDKMCLRLGTKLGYGSTKMRTLMRTYSDSKSFGRYKKLEEDSFKIIADWYYYAILELTYCETFKPSPRWISRVLELPFIKTLDAVERLKRLNFLEVTPDGRWIDRMGDAHNMGSENQASSFMEHEKQVLSKAIEAMDKVSRERRLQSSMTLAVAKEKVPEARKMILNFIEELSDYLKSSPTKDEVYNIVVSLYPLTETSNGEIPEV